MPVSKAPASPEPKPRLRHLNDTLFSTFSEARSAINSWKEDYNHHRPHSALGNMPPAEFAKKSTLEKQAA
jgi:putative transposase